MLSRAPSAPIQIPGSEDAIHLTREELERVAGPLVDRAVDETRRVLDRANLPPGALAGILLVGGSSRIPLVASRLHARFQVAPTVPEQPELPVAYGGLLVVPPGGPISPAAGPTGPVSAAPYAPAPTTGPTPVPYPVPQPGWAPQPAPPPQWRPPPPAWAPQPPPEPASFDRSVKSAYASAGAAPRTGVWGTRSRSTTPAGPP